MLASLGAGLLIALFLLIISNVVVNRRDLQLSQYIMIVVFLVVILLLNKMIGGII